MRSPPPCIAPKVHDAPKYENQPIDEGSVCSFSSASSMNQQRPGLSFAPPAWGNSNNQRTQPVRVVARIRPSTDSGERFVFALKADENLSRLQTPVKVSSQSEHKIADLVSMFNSPDAKPIAPSFLSPTAETPLHVNKRVHDVAPKTSSRITMIQPPTPCRDLADSARVVVDNICASIPQVVLAGDKSFNFDAVVDISASQQDVFSFTVGDAIRRNIFKGYNTTIITYGQRNSGKTYTMYGSKQDIDPNIPDDASIRTEEAYGSHENDGIAPRAIQDLFRAKDTQVTGSDVILNMSFIEIYNDGVIDLLTCKRSSLPIRDNGDKTGIPVKGLTHIRIKSTSHARHILEAAQRRRISSSRSHTICTINAVMNPAVKKSVTNGKHASVTTTDVITAKLTLVDLAGSDRSRLGNTVEEQKESACIKKDMLVLSKCINALTENSKVEAKLHVPFRDCKLTRLLSDSLGGNSYTVIVACVNPSAQYSEETLSVLKNAEQARNILNTIKMNRSKISGLTPAEGAALRRENKVLKSHMLEMTKKMQILRRCNNNSEFLNDPEVVIDFGSLQFCSPRSFKSVEKQTDDERWRMKFEKLLNICKKENLNIPLEEIGLDENDESLLRSHAREIQELKEQINHLMRFDDDCMSTTSGLTADFDDRSVVSNITMLSLSQQSLRTCETLENMKATETEDERGLIRKTNSSPYHSKEDVINFENRLMIFKEERELLEKNNVQLEKCVSDNLVRKSALESSIEQLKHEVKVLTEEKIHLYEEVDDLQNSKSLISDLSNEKAARFSLEKELAIKTEELFALKSSVNASLSELSDNVRAPDDEKDDELKHLRQKVASYEAILMTYGDKCTDNMINSNSKESIRVENTYSNDEELVKSITPIIDEGNVAQLKDKIIALQSELEMLKKLHIKPPLLPIGSKRKAMTNNHPNASPKRISSNNSVISVSKLLTDYEHDEDDSHGFAFYQKKNKELSCSAKEKSALDAFNASFDQNYNISASFDDSCVQEDTSLSSDHRAIRIHAQKLLFFADKAVSQNFTDSFSIASDADKENTSFNHSTEGPINTSTNSSFSFSGKVGTSSSKFTVGCVCPTSLFSGNADHIEFFLPRLGKACKCGAEEKAKSRFQDPTSLQAFLRSWQVSFLSDVGIFTAKQLIYKQRSEARTLAKALQKYRNSKKLKPVRCKSALVALHIWSRTAQTVLNSHKDEIVRHGSIFAAQDFSTQKPSLLEIDVNNDDDVSLMSMEPHLYEGEYEV